MIWFTWKRMVEEMWGSITRISHGWVWVIGSEIRYKVWRWVSFGNGFEDWRWSRDGWVR